MENVADALKMASAVLIFVIAFSITMIMFSQAKTTTDSIVDNLKLQDFMPRTNDIINVGDTRMVGIETIIPTLYRYCQSDDNIRIRILDESGNELQVFDANIESLVNSGLDVDKNNDPNFDYYSSLAEKYNDPNKPAYMFGAPWCNQGIQYYLERINAYIYGIPAQHMDEITYHTTGNNLMRYSGRTFAESYLEYKTDGKTIIDEFGEEIPIIKGSTQTIISYRLQP